MTLVITRAITRAITRGLVVTLACSTVCTNLAAQAAVSKVTTSQAKLVEARTLFLQGQIAYTEGQLMKARAKLEGAYKLAPSAELDFDLGRVYERTGEPEAAITHFRRYLDSSLDATERARIESRINALRALAARQSAQLAELPPSSNALTSEALAFFERGKKFFHRRLYEAALAAFAAAQRFAPVPELTYNLALTSERLGRISDAVEYYRKYLRESPDAKDAALVQARIAELSADTTTDRSLRPAAQ